MKTPTVPEVKKPKEPIQADSVRDVGKQYGAGASPQGLSSFVSAGRLSQKAKTVRSSLLG